MSDASAAARVAPPRIGLTMYREDARWGVWQEPADLLPASYSAAVLDAGGVPLLLPAGSDRVPGAVGAALAGLDGLLIAGGADVDPARYGAQRHGETGAARPDRDGWELALVRAAIARDLPVLGVCRGMQVLAVALGGTLVQHLPDVVGHDGHCPTPGRHGRHPVRVSDGTVLAGWSGTTAQVATYHHQAVEVLPDGASAIGWAEDGTIEAIEVRGPSEFSFTLGVQWHPEVRGPVPADSTAGRAPDALFSGFVNWCRERRDAPHRGSLVAPEVIDP